MGAAFRDMWGLVFGLFFLNGPCKGGTIGNTLL